ncbi:Fe(3+)-hydroxamate ABC transporter permease FhuB [Roseibium litorale]|uniref:Fe(3+)-hydroxamate ABC transporter permease FhuB n=1 Tax=Roseibium litorale TaxID=2803841 RepID=A0ABR9CRY2_9HYPH|nr:Fe(3+)-hydroxamate ABC transporter permease FhuB [Roseibium litorale]MBD8893642.1 Fe(3+)-hydroxamate ABC transporter permease FhuB [Roseibium litorale]
MTSSRLPLLRVWPLLCLAALLVFLAGSNISAIGGGSLWGPIWSGTTSGTASSIRMSYVYSPQLVMALLSGSGLGFAGCVFQLSLLNPLASPSTLGVSSGAQLALTLTLLLAPELHASHAFAIALTGSFLAWGLVAAIGGRRLEDPLTLLLSGMAVSFTLAAVTTCLFILKDHYLNSMFIWGAGDLAQNGWDGVRFLAPKLVFGAAIVLAMSRPLSLLGLGTGVARSAGVPVGWARAIVLSAAILITAAITAAVGIIAFVGLAAPHIARMAGARRVIPQLLTAALTGALLLGVTDQALQFLLKSLASFLPAGALAGMLGAPLILYLMRKMAKPPVQPEHSLWLRPHIIRSRADQWRLVAICCMVLLVCLAIALGLPSLDLPLILDWRAPRVLTALLAGCALGCAGCLGQRLLGNPMASPESMGISAGAIMGTVLVLLILPAAGTVGQTAGALGGALIVLMSVLFYGRHQDFDPRSLILVGIAITAIADAAILIFFATGDPRVSQVLALMSGSTYRASYELLSIPAGLSLVAVLMILPALRWLDILPIGNGTARALGMPLALARTVIIISMALLTVAATLLAGPITFVGLAAPQIARVIGLRSTGSHLAGSAALGGSVIVFSDFAGRRLFLPYELPAGLMSVLIGAFGLVLTLTVLRFYGKRRRGRDTAVRGVAA